MYVLRKQPGDISWDLDLNPGVRGRQQTSALSHHAPHARLLWRGSRCLLLAAYGGVLTALGTLGALLRGARVQATPAAGQRGKLRGRAGWVAVGVRLGCSGAQGSCERMGGKNDERKRLKPSELAAAQRAWAAVQKTDAAADEGKSDDDDDVPLTEKEIEAAERASVAALERARAKVHKELDEFGAEVQDDAEYERGRRWSAAGVTSGGPGAAAAREAKMAEEIAADGWRRPEPPARIYLKGREAGTGRGIQDCTPDEREELEIRDLQMLDLHRRGYSYNSIARHFKIQPRAVYDGCMRVVDASHRGMERNIAHIRMEAQYREALKISENPGPLISTTGRIVRDDDGNVVEDKKIKLAALGEMRMLVKEERAMMGLDEQKKTIIELREEHEVTVQLESRLQALMEQGVRMEDLLGISASADVVEADVVEDGSQSPQLSARHSSNPSFQLL